MDKERLRRALRDKREGLGARERGRWSAALSAEVMGHPAWGRAHAVAAFVGVNGEPDTRPVLEVALAEGKRLWLPRVVGRDRIVWVAVVDLDAQLEAGGFGLMEPRVDPGVGVLDPLTPDAGVDLVLVPGLAFSSAGGRIGFGKGYYDKALAPVATARGPVRMGVCFSCFLDPVEGPIPMRSHDVSMHFVATEVGVTVCGADRAR